ncbi:mitochondrial carrier [Nemania sp. NC0429]|nr:mitochondrial carrier [Nemania sp. NC0429]
MSADFWAGYISGAVGIIVGNPLDMIKVRLQAQSPSQPPLAEPAISASHQSSRLSVSSVSSARPLPPQSVPIQEAPLPTAPLISRYRQLKTLVTGTAAPVLGYGFINALLFLAYNRSEEALNRALLPRTSPSLVFSNSDVGGSTTGSNLWTTWLAGAIGGLATWIVSTPTERIKCRAQLASAPGAQASSSASSTSTSPSTPSSSYQIARAIIRSEGFRGLYHGGVVTALRDSIGYGFYFWSYELGGRIVTSFLPQALGSTASLNSGGIDNGASSAGFFTQETAKVLLSGGVAGVVSWVSIYPLDVVKTRVQGQVYPGAAVDPAAAPLLGTHPPRRKGAIQIAREAYREGGARVFFRGLTACSLRAFCVNAVQWFFYEEIMLRLGQSNRDRQKRADYM